MGKGTKVLCRLCGIVVDSALVLVAHWQWEMEQKGNLIGEVETEDERHVPHAEVKQVVKNEGDPFFKQEHMEDNNVSRVKEEIDDLQEDLPLNSRMLSCDECIYTCMNKKTLNMHKHRKHGLQAPVTGIIYCDKCDYTCSNRESLAMHEYRKHDGIKPTPRYQCDKCEYASSKQEWIIKHDYRKHGGPKPIQKYQCDECAHVLCVDT